jgi:hypothetical protein
MHLSQALVVESQLIWNLFSFVKNDPAGLETGIQHGIYTTVQAAVMFAAV